MSLIIKKILLKIGISLFFSGTLIAQEPCININSGAYFTIGFNAMVTVQGNIEVEGSGSLIIKSTADGSGSLIVTGSVSGNVDIQRYIVGYETYEASAQATHGWHQLGSPVADFNIEGSNFDPGANDDLYIWSEDQGLWLNYKASEFTQIQQGIGYLIADALSSTKTFSGTLPNADIERSGLTKSGGTYTGWHLLGNPFLSALEWNDGNWSLVNIDDNCQIWNETNASYTVISSGNGIIPAMNGFMVHANTDGASLTIPKAACTHNETGWYKNSASYSNAITLTAYDPYGQTAQPTIIRFNPEASEGYDTKYDSHFLGGYAPRFYSVSVNEQYALNTLPELSPELQIPLEFIRNESTNFYIKAEGIKSLEPFSPVYLTDLKTNTTQNLTDNPIYDFIAEEGDDPSRFFIHFQAVGIDEPSTSNQTMSVMVWNHERTLNISNPEQLTGTVVVINMAGQTVLIGQLGNLTKQTINHTLNPGLYVVQIQAKNKHKNQKILIK